MRRVNTVFVGVVAVSVAVGGVAGAGFGGELDAINTIDIVDQQLDSTVTELRLVDGTLRVSIRIENPTGYPVRLHGTFVRVFEGSREQLAYGSGQRLDDAGDVVPARGHLSPRYLITLSPEQADRLRAEFRRDTVRLTVFHSMSLRGERFRIARTNITVRGEVGR